jgi:hypothetical protein
MRLDKQGKSDMAVVNLVLRGVISGSQTWSTHVDFAQLGSGAVGQTDLDTWLAGAKTQLDTFWSTANGIGAQNETTTTYTQLQAYYRPGPGGTPLLVSSVVVAKAGTSATSNIWPWQCCMVATLLTGFPGRKERGRMYLPCNRPVGVTAVHQFNATATGAVSGSLALALHNINALPLATNGLFAQPLNSTRLYQRVAVDNRPDIQRRRTDKLPSSASAVTTI